MAIDFLEKYMKNGLNYHKNYIFHKDIIGLEDIKIYIILIAEKRNFSNQNSQDKKRMAC